ncbi:MAG: hypothetical protein ACRDJ5_09145, partial [Actinomycetota bacterium]
VQGYSSVGYSQGVPNRWANIFVQSLGPAGADALVGPCGEIDDAFTELLGPDPRYECGEDGEAVPTEPGLPLPGPRVRAGGTPALPGDVGDLVDTISGPAATVGGAP